MPTIAETDRPGGAITGEGHDVPIDLLDVTIETPNGPVTGLSMGFGFSCEPAQFRVPEE